MKIKYVLLPVLLISFYACKTRTIDQQPDDQFEISDVPDSHPEAREIIYYLDLPTDIAQLFEETGTNFDPDLPILLDDINRYDQAEQMAVIMGALGVDLSYCKIFDQHSFTGTYYEAIETVSGKLNLPNSIFEKSSQYLEKYFDNQDSLTVVINCIYSEVDQYFKSHNQEQLASLSLLGGWVESMFIGVNIYKNYNHHDMAERILQQKFALNNLVSLLSNYQESLSIRGYILMLNKLKSLYDKVEIRYSKEGFEIDTARKKLQSSHAEITYEPDTLSEICKLIIQIRQELLK